MVDPTAAPRPVSSEAEPAPTRSRRRRMLAGLVGGVVAVLGGRLVDPAPTEAAAGNPAILGKPNSAGSKSTSISASVGTAAAVLGKNASATGYGVYGQSTATSGSTRGVYGRTASSSGVGVYAYQGAASHGTGAALRADGVHNTALRASTADAGSHGIHATSAAQAGVVGLFEATAGPGDGMTGGVAVRGPSGGGAVSDIHRTGRADPQAAGEFAGHIGVIAAPTAAASAGPGLRAGLLALGDGDAFVAWATNETGTALYASSDTGTAFRASSSSGTGIAASGYPWAGDFSGAVRTGNLTSSSVVLAVGVVPSAPSDAAVLYAGWDGAKYDLAVRFPNATIKFLANDQ